MYQMVIKSPPWNSKIIHSGFRLVSIKITGADCLPLKTAYTGITQTHRENNIGQNWRGDLVIYSIF